MRYFLSIILLLGGCRQTSPISTEPTVDLMGTPTVIDEEMTLTQIAFGSCNKETRDQGFWKQIVKQNPKLWIWLGDNIYGDTQDMNLLKYKYASVKNNVAYQALMASCPIIGTWDDHDYGVNDGGKNFAMKKESSKVLLDFLDVPAEAEVRDREGIYQSYTIGKQGQRVKVILLDARYFRDDLIPDPSGLTRYLQNKTGDVLGEAQWNWLQQELSNSDANLHLIANGYQIIPEEQIYEKWSNFPQARQQLFDLLVSTNAKNVMLLSGDRHISELSKIDLNGLAYPLYEFTSSGLTHTWSLTVPRPEPNKYRIGEMVIEKSFGMLQFDWKVTEVIVKVQARGFEDNVYLEETISFSK